MAGSENVTGASLPEKLPAAGWLGEPEVAQVMDALLAGASVEARFVGGCVRDVIRGRHHYEGRPDIDVATTAEPEQVIELLTQAGLKAVPTGIDHGTITAVANHRPVEVTTLRCDVATDGRRADVVYTSDWVADAQRRDLTMNAIYAERDGTLFDPLGTGIADAVSGTVRFVGDPDTRIREDYLRILRFFRFFAHCGTGEMDRDGLAACARNIDGIAQLSAERIATELLKLVAADDPIPALRQMAATGVLNAVLPEACNIDRLRALCAIDADNFFTPDPLLRLGALLPDDAEQAEALARRLRLSNAQRARLSAMLGADERIFCYMSVRETRRAAYRLGPAVMRDATMLRWAEDPKHDSNMVQWRALLPMIDSWQPPKFPLSGEQVKLAGVPEGPEIGRVIAEVEAWWIDADFTQDQYALLERLKAIVQATVL